MGLGLAGVKVRVSGQWEGEVRCVAVGGGGEFGRGGRCVCGRRQAAGGRRQAAGGRQQAAGGRQQAAGERRSATVGDERRSPSVAPRSEPPPKGSSRGVRSPHLVTVDRASTAARDV